MPENAILLHVDYAKNYENKQQADSQSAYFGNASFSIFTAVAYIRLNEKTKKISSAEASEAKDPSRIVSHSCFLKAIDTVTITYSQLDQFGSLDIHLWSYSLVPNSHPGLYFS